MLKYILNSWKQVINQMKIILFDWEYFLSTNYINHAGKKNVVLKQRNLCWIRAGYSVTLQPVKDDLTSIIAVKMWPMATSWSNWASYIFLWRKKQVWHLRISLWEKMIFAQSKLRVFGESAHHVFSPDYRRTHKVMSSILMYNLYMNCAAVKYSDAGSFASWSSA